MKKPEQKTPKYTTNPNTVLLNGFPKSGNYLVWKILYLIQSHWSIYQSYITRFPLAPTSVANGQEKDYIFKHADIIDGITINDKQIAFDLTWQSYGAPQQIEHTSLFQYSSLLWCHDALSNEKFDLLNANVKHIIYVYRDVEAVLKSFAVHSLRFQQFNPKYSLSDPQDVIDNEKFIVNNAERWNTHVQYYLANKDSMHLVNYSNLTHNKTDVIAKLITTVMPQNTVLSAQQLQTLILQIMHETSLSFMQAESKNHVNTRSSSLVISERNRALIAEISGETRDLIAQS